MLYTLDWVHCHQETLSQNGAVLKYGKNKPPIRILTQHWLTKLGWIEFHSITSLPAMMLEGTPHKRTQIWPQLASFAHIFTQGCWDIDTQILRDLDLCQISPFQSSSCSPRVTSPTHSIGYQPLIHPLSKVVFNSTWELFIDFSVICFLSGSRTLYNFQTSVIGFGHKMMLHKYLLLC